MSKGRIALYVLLIVLSDQIAKFFFINTLTAGQSIPVIASVFHLTLVFNKGAAFGIFNNAVWAFILISIAVIGAIVVLLRKKNLRSDIKAGLSLILGGAISNLIDRLRFGYVIDYIDLRVWPVFNIADSAITIASIWLMWRIYASNPD